MGSTTTVQIFCVKTQI